MSPRVVTLDNQTYRLDIWDTAGQVRRLIDTVI